MRSAIAPTIRWPGKSHAQAGAAIIDPMTKKAARIVLRMHALPTVRGKFTPVGGTHVSRKRSRPDRQMPRASSGDPGSRLSTGAEGQARGRRRAISPWSCPASVRCTPRSLHERMVGATSPAGPPRLPSKGEGVQDKGARKQRAQDQSEQLGNTTLTHLSLPFQALVARTIFPVQKSLRGGRATPTNPFKGLAALRGHSCARDPRNARCRLIDDFTDNEGGVPP